MLTQNHCIFSKSELSSTQAKKEKKRERKERKGKKRRRKGEVGGVATMEGDPETVTHLPA